ncbi:hypothetical protein [Agriterribacter sp.]|uniref:hypothetical protein n=1 Tax=Agriterribacter sp. TaxID=2821509 RepID=UPI002B8B9A6E|nr:hypothetical protein [Agriterribacter sp.]HTN08419.1 hypothetical protein [Agriterribacter sp.]
MLDRQKKTEHPTEALGITIGKPDEKWKIINELITQQKSKIQTMKKWCDETQINFTPTYFHKWLPIT